MRLSRHVAISVVVAVAVAAGVGAGSVPALAAPLTAAGPAASTKPVVNSIQPSTGPTAGGTTVQIFGARLTGATSVDFGSAAATIKSDTAGEVDVVSPQGTSGAVDVTVTTAAGTSAINGNDVFTYSNQPTVQSLTPAQGPSSGGTEVQIFGSLFTGATAVHFGTAAASGLTVVSSTEIDVLSPAVSADGTVDVTVTGPGGTSAINPSDEFTYNTIPAVSDLSVNTGPTAGGTAVQIFGANFTSATAVHFGSANASIQNITDGEVDVTSPAESAGTVDVTVTTPKGTSPINGADVFTYSDVPTVTSVTPSTGPSAGGTPVVIAGTNLGSLTSVHFGTAAAQIASKSTDSVTVISPAHADGTVDITATNASGTSAVNNSDLFTYSDAPTVGCPSQPGSYGCGVTPGYGPTAGGTPVQIFGDNLSGTTAVHFGSALATDITNVSPSEVDAIAPAGALGNVNVTVTTAFGTSAISSLGVFSYSNVPIVYGLSTTTGPTAGGTTVDIYGANFTGATAVHFGKASAAFTVTDDSDIQATSPAHTAGTVRVTVTTPNGTDTFGNGNDLFTYGPAPVVNGLSPSTGPTAGGTRVVIDGTNLAGARAVDFGSTAATIKSDSASKIVVTAPAQAAGQVDVTVTTSAGTSDAGYYDIYTYSDQPSVSDLSVSTGPTAGGNAVTVYGVNLSGAQSVYFGTQPATITGDSASQVEVTVPAETAGTVDVTVTTTHGTSLINGGDEYAYSDQPVVDSIYPAQGPTAGGTHVQIYGSAFTGATAVTFGGKAAKKFTIASDSQINAVAPARSAGTVNITVTNPAGTSVISGNDEYTFSDTPDITGLDTFSGTTAGGTPVAVYGDNLTGATAVTFGGTAAASFTVISSTEVDAVSPASAAGTVNIQVTTPHGTTAINGNDEYTYTDQPTVDSISPAQGPTAGGTAMQIYGTNLTGTTSVMFGTVAATGVTVVSSTQVNATAPAHSAGTVNVTLTTPAGTSAVTGTDEYTYTDLPVVQALSVYSGPAAGGTAVDVYGTNLSGATAVDFGTTPAASFTVVSSGEVDTVSPAHPAGAVHITVTTPAGTSVISGNDIYSFGAAAAGVIGTSRAGGPMHGGTLLRIYGTKLGGVRKVLFGHTAAARLIHVSRHEVDVISPPHLPGPVDLHAYTTAGTAIPGAAPYTFRKL